MPQKQAAPEQDKLTRIAIVDADKCKPKNCGLACKKACPVNRLGKQCIVVEASSKIAFISEELCIGCGICVKVSCLLSVLPLGEKPKDRLPEPINCRDFAFQKCPYGAISIINLPSNLEKATTHRYSANSFKLHRLPTPRPGEVLGLVGTNGIGKSTALKILAGKLKPNLGNFQVSFLMVSAFLWSLTGGLFFFRIFPTGTKS